MLTPGEGVLNTGAMGLVGEPAVNALNRMGKGITMAGGGVVGEREKNYDNPTAEETRDWTEADWAEWRKRHPRFDAPAPTPEPEHLRGGGVAGRGRGRGGRGLISAFDPERDNPGDFGGTHSWFTPPGGQGPLDNPNAIGGVDIPEADEGSDYNYGESDYGPMPGLGGYQYPQWGVPGGGTFMGGQLGDYVRQLGKFAPTGKAEGGIVQGYAEGTPSVEIDTGPYRSSWQQWLDIRNPVDNLGSSGPGSFRGFQNQFQNRPPPPVYPPGMVPGETLGVRDKMRMGGGYQGPGYGWAPSGGPGWSPFPGAGAGTPGMGGSLSGLAGMPSQGFNWKPWLDKMFAGRTQATAGAESGGIVMEDGVVPSFQKGGVVPIGYSAPIEEQEWQKLVQFVPANVDIAKLREQADKSGISADTLMKLFSSMGGAGSGGGTSSGYGSGPIGGWVGYGG